MFTDLQTLWVYRKILGHHPGSGNKTKICRLFQKEQLRTPSLSCNVNLVSNETDTWKEIFRGLFKSCQRNTEIQYIEKVWKSIPIYFQ